MSRHFTIASVILGMSSCVSPAAVSLNLTSNPFTGPQFTIGFTSFGAVPDGMLVRIGTFLQAPSANDTFQSLEGQFLEFGRSTIGHNTASAPVNQGRLNRFAIMGIDGGTSPHIDSEFIGRTVYLWVYNSVTELPYVPQGIFSASLFTFRDQITAQSISITTFDRAYGHDGWGDVTSLDRNPDGQTTFLRLAPVGLTPEPSTALMTCLSAGIALMRRRRVPPEPA